ncbi:MAG: hypothetical protein H6718_03205 [Polyangiaceae bacterium]|nr:hypothetical protein [Polyangiaceae bacterium]
MTWIDPDKNPEAWEQAIIGGVPTLGLATVSGGKYTLGWDAKKGTAKSGASTVFTGKELAECTLTITFSDGAQGLSASDQIDQFLGQIVPILQKSENGKTAIDFYHPQVSEPPIGLTSVVVKTIGQIEKQDDGLKTVTVELIQFKRPRAAPVAKPTGSASKSPSEETAQDAQDRVINELREVWEGLLNG